MNDDKMNSNKTRNLLMKDCIKLVKRGIPTQYLKEKYEGSTEEIIRVIGIRSIQEGYIDTDNIDMIRIQDKNIVKKATVNVGDLIITLRGSSIKIAVADSSVDGCAISANLIALTLTENIKPEIVAAYMNGPIGQSELNKRAGGSCMFSLNLERLKEVPIPVKPMEEQEELLQFIELSSEYRRKLVQELELWDNMTNSFITEKLGI